MCLIGVGKNVGEGPVKLARSILITAMSYLALLSPDRYRGCKATAVPGVAGNNVGFFGEP